jgi:hypothetical protein
MRQSSLKNRVIGSFELLAVQLARGHGYSQKWGRPGDEQVV